MLRLLTLAVTVTLPTLTLTALATGQDQYKRVHQRALRQLLRGELDRVTASLDAFEAEFPEDAESAFMRTLVALRRGDRDAAVAHMQRAVALGLPAERFFAEPRELLAPLRDAPAAQALGARLAGRLVHGPLVGAVTDRTARIWVRTAAPARVHVEARAAGAPPRRASARTVAADDCAAVIDLDGLAPQTRYTYRVAIDDRAAPANDAAWFTTAPRPGTPAKFTLAFGGGAGYVPQHERVWTTIDQRAPDLLLLLGDNVYIDDPKSDAQQRYCYARRQSRPEFRNLVAHTPTCAIWDDHDFGTNDCHGGPAIERPPWKRSVWQVFRRNWANPGYGGGAERPGCWFRLRRGDVDFFLLDGRYYRTGPRAEPPTMLGPIQRAWLERELRASRATFKVLCSPVPWEYRTKGASSDTWNGFRAERDALFGMLARERIGGVVLLSADRHRSDAWRIDRGDGAYALYEFNSSRLTNQHTHPVMPEALFSYNRKPSFGLVAFDTTVADPTITYTIVSIDGEPVHRLELRASQLTAR